jgi:putative transposase
LVFVLKYRRKGISERVLANLRQSFETVCSDFDAELKECDGETDHVHLLVEYPPKVSISELVNSLKGVSSRMVRRENYPEVQRVLWGDHFWSPSYFAASCGGAPLEILKTYIQHQAGCP